jgi:hypothetical protein
VLGSILVTPDQADQADQAADRNIHSDGPEPVLFAEPGAIDSVSSSGLNVAGIVNTCVEWHVISLVR